ncbi:MAG: hypothetical protein K0S21_2491 [Rhizobiaceae bacterium]|nr:hypothetical protein [Rhizobiaceae bacterium]
MAEPSLPAAPGHWDEVAKDVRGSANRCQARRHSRGTACGNLRKGPPANHATGIVQVFDEADWQGKT